jgi:glycerol-3-phosphate dehydrogenase
MVFAIPRDGKTYVGTTDTTYKGDIAHPRMTLTDRIYVLNAINGMFPTLQLTESEVESSWTGLRPLIHQEGKDPSEISRKDEIFVSASGLISIAGGKLTGYRKMAEMVVNKVDELRQQEGQPPALASSTKHMPISGGDVGGSTNLPRFIDEQIGIGKRLGLSVEEAEQLVRRYGSNVDKVFAILEKHGAETGEYSLPAAVLAALIYAIEHEMVVKPVDFFIRRTGALFFNIGWVHQWKEAVITYMAKQFSWSEEQVQEYAVELEIHLHDAVVPLDKDE